MQQSKYFVHLKPTIKGYLPINDIIETNDTLKSEIQRKYKGYYELDYEYKNQEELNKVLEIRNYEILGRLK